MKRNRNGISVGKWLELRTGDRTVLDSNPAGGTLANPFILLCQCLSEETLKVVGPFYLVSMQAVKYPTQGVNV